MHVDYWTDFSEAYLYLPLTITTSAGNFAPLPTIPAVAFKSSALSALHGVVVKTATGQPLLDERGTLAFSSHLRACFEKDQDWLELVAPEIHYARDRPEVGCVGMNNQYRIPNPSVSKYTAAVAVGLIGDDGNKINPLYNAGFDRRRQHLARSATSDLGVVPAMNVATIACNLRIPLKCIHDYFRQAFAFPYIGTRLMFEFYLQNSVNSSFCPITIGSAVAPADAVTPPVQSTGGTPTIAITPGAQPRLYYHAVQFKAEQNALVAQKLAKGFSKRAIFKSHEMYKDISTQQNVASGSQFQYQITTSAVAAKRLWVLMYPAGVISGSTWPSTLVTGPYGMTNVQLTLNGKTQFNNPLQTTDEQYQMLKQAMRIGSDSGDPEALLPYEDFRIFSRVMCFDISRAHSLAADPNAPLAITISATTSTPGNADIVYLIESQRELQMDFSAQEVRAVVGPALFR